MNYLKGALGLKKDKGNVLGNGVNTSRPSGPSNSAPTRDTRSGSFSTYDAVFDGNDALLGMTIACSQTGIPVVGSLVSGGAASRKGVHIGDIVMSVDGNPVTSYESLEVALCAMERPVTFSFHRSGKSDRVQRVARPTLPPSDESGDVERRRRILTAAEERSRAWDRKVQRAGGNHRGASKKSGEGLDRFGANDDEATKAQVAQIKKFEAAQTAALGYNPYESHSMSRAQALARIELAGPTPSGSNSRTSAAALSPLNSQPHPPPSWTPTSLSPSLSGDRRPFVAPLSQEELESPEAFQAGEEADSAMALMLDQPLPAWRTAASTVLTILGNVLADPAQEKFRRVRLQNAAFQSKVVAVPGAVDMLHAAGFCYTMEDQETFLSLPGPALEVPLRARVIYYRIQQVLEDTQDPLELPPLS